MSLSLSLNVHSFPVLDTESQSTGDYGCSSNTNADSTDVERVVIKTEPKEEPDTASDEKPALSHSVDTGWCTNISSF